MNFPKMFRIRQKFASQKVDDVPRAVRESLAILKLHQNVKSGETVALTVGSRGIANISIITRAVVDYLKSIGAQPFLVPAMGSHGGATADGQVGVLASLGITETSVGCEIRSSMETEIVATTAQGIPVHFDRHAFHADHVIIMGRIKPHTLFTGEIESGLHKMMLIGLGKHIGAAIYHRAITNYSFSEIIQSVAAEVLAKCRIIAGIAIVENAYDETALIEAVAPRDFEQREKALLILANGWLPTLPFPNADLLIVDQIGKNISGSGMDSNVIGRKYNDHAAQSGDRANCHRILVRSLTPQTKGNACGIGLAEFTTQHVVDQIDPDYTRVNCITAGHPTAGMIPLVYPNDRAAIADALKTVGLVEPENARVIQITDTLHLAETLVSEIYLQQTQPFPHDVLSGPDLMQFDSQGKLQDVIAHG